jgi:exopolysaccharide production protein ExoQ
VIVATDAIALPAREPALNRAGILLSLRTRVNLGLLAWLAMYFSILIWTRSDAPDSQIGDSTNYYRILLVLFAGGASVWVLLRNGARIRQAFPGPLLLLFFYGIVAMISSLYVPSYAFYAMWKGCEVTVDVLCVAALLSYASSQDNARTAYRMLPFLNGILVLVYLVEALSMPAVALLPSRGYIPVYMVGVLPVMTQNALAFLSAVTALAIIARLHRPGRVVLKCLYLSMLCPVLATLILAQSRTSVVALVLALVAYLLYDRRWISLGVLVAACMVAAMYTQISDLSFQYLLRGQDEELVTSLSGRTEGWEAAWESFQESPVVGQGFAAFARANILGSSGMSSLHGALFEVMVGTGLLGLIPWVVAIVWTFVRLASLPLGGHPWFRSPVGRSIQAEMVGVACLIVVRASTSSGLAVHEDNFMLFLTVLAYTSAMLRAARSEPYAELRMSQTGAQA